MRARKIPAVLMRGGTSKGLFFHADALPADPVERDRILLRIVGSPDPYGKQIDGLGGATSSTSKVVLISKSGRPDCDVDYFFGQVAIDRPVIDWSGNCGNLTAAVGPFAIEENLVAPAVQNGFAEVRIWQVNIGKRILARVPVRDGLPVEEGDFRLDGVAFPAAEIGITFLDPGGSADAALLPTGNVCDNLEVPGIGSVRATLLNAGNPTIFIYADALGRHGTELPAELNRDAALLARCEAIRAHGAVAMRLAATAQEATEKRPHTPKLALLAAPQSYVASDSRHIDAKQIDVLARILSMGQFHHAITGTGAVALAAAAALPGTLVNALLPTSFDPASSPVRIGHASGVLAVGAEAACDSANGTWTITAVRMSRSARRLMEGCVRVPASLFAATCPA